MTSDTLERIIAPFRAAGWSASDIAWAVGHLPKERQQFPARPPTGNLADGGPVRCCQRG